MLLQVGFEVGVGGVEKRTDLQRAEVLVQRDDVESGTVRVLRLPQSRQPDQRGELLHAALERLQFHLRAELLERCLVAGVGYRAVHGIAVCNGDPGQVGTQIQVERAAEKLGVEISRRSVVAVVDPEHRDAWLRPGGQVQDHGLVGTEVCGNHGAA